MHSTPHDDQRAAIAFLGRASCYGPGVERVEIVETHVSIVFLAGDHAYKLKRAVRLPYLDFSTVRRRHRACAAELALNRRTAPALYLDLRRLGRDSAGGVGFSNRGTAVDWVVVMRRFDQALLFDALAKAGRLEPRVMDALADHIVGFHEAAERRFDWGGAAAIGAIGEENHGLLAAAQQAGFPEDRVQQLYRLWRQRLSAVAQLLDRRRDAGQVRRCHGDLHLRNICLLDGEPTLFDCLEFSERLACIDTLYDIAFLLMDLEYRGLVGHASRVLNRYLDRCGDEEGLRAMPLFLSLRAGIRAHVTATAIERAASGDAPAMAGEARGYLDLAYRALQPPQPARLVAIGGLSGSGKSTLAAALAPELGTMPGARLLRSDVTRKLLLGVAPETPLPNDTYHPDVTRRVYDALRQKAATALAAGYSVIIDAVSLQPDERTSFAEVARGAGVSFSGLWLDAEAEAMTSRIARRRGDASDATAAILEQQLRGDPGPIDWTRIDAGDGMDECLAAARRALALD
ncbi:MAG: AAA family ATPase [Stellaceae bacterium]